MRGALLDKQSLLSKATQPYEGRAVPIVLGIDVEPDRRVVDLADPSGAFRGAYRAWALAQGMDEEAVSAMFDRIATNFHPVDEVQLASLLAEAGCGAPMKYFQALGYCGYLSLRN